MVTNPEETLNYPMQVLYVTRRGLPPTLARDQAEAERLFRDHFRVNVVTQGELPTPVYTPGGTTLGEIHEVELPSWLNIIPEETQ